MNNKIKLNEELKRALLLDVLNNIMHEINTAIDKNVEESIETQNNKVKKTIDDVMSFFADKNPKNNKNTKDTKNDEDKKHTIFNCNGFVLGVKDVDDALDSLDTIADYVEKEMIPYDIYECLLKKVSNHFNIEIGNVFDEDDEDDYDYVDDEEYEDNYDEEVEDEGNDDQPRSVNSIIFNYETEEAFNKILQKMIDKIDEVMNNKKKEIVELIDNDTKKIIPKKIDNDTLYVSLNDIKTLNRFFAIGHLSKSQSKQTLF